MHTLRQSRTNSGLRELSQKQVAGGASGIYFPPSRASPTEALNVMPGEILMAKRHKGSRYKGAALHCFSSCNGLYLHEGMKDLVYAGVAITGFTMGEKQQEQQGFVSQMGGLNTIVNTGDKVIHPGDILRVALPEPDYKAKRKTYVEGTPKDKIVFKVVPVDQYEQDVLDKAAESGRSKNADLQAALDGMPAGTNKKEVLRKLWTYFHDQRRFEIGKALSYAQEGHPFDVLLSL